MRSAYKNIRQIRNSGCLFKVFGLFIFFFIHWYTNDENKAIAK